MNRALLWFRNDLRTADNEALVQAIEHHDEVLPVLIIDPLQHGNSPFGYERSGNFRRAFFNQSVHALDAQLRAKGSGLRIFTGDPATVLGRLAKEWHCSVVHAQELYAWEERTQEDRVAAALDLRKSCTHGLLHVQDLPFSLEHLPHVFTAFRTKVEKQFTVRPPLPDPAFVPTPSDWIVPTTLPDALPCIYSEADPRAAFRSSGDRSAGLGRLRYYFWETGSIARYKQTRNGLLGADYSSKLSAWLSTGALSAREIYHALRQYEQQNGANESTYWLIFELLWRDFFQFTAAKHGPHFFRHGGIAQKRISRRSDRALFNTWSSGQTGQPFIDANMRELSATGWMSNRGRQNVASYLVHDLGLDWRMGAYWFEHMLIDYDPCSNWGNWQYIAGVGNDPREGRRFDPQRQASMYDPDGDYVSTWNT